METGELILRFIKEKYVFNVFEAMKHHKENPQCYKVDVGEDVIPKRAKGKQRKIKLQPKGGGIRGKLQGE